MVDCAFCAFRFDPAGTSLCDSCPLGKGCALVCCPHCGYSAPDVERSLAARAVAAFARRRARSMPVGALARLAPGCRARIASLDELPERQRGQLLAYGLAPGRLVEVLQRSPVTVVRVEHTELALESSISRAVLVAPEASPA